jgi:CDP-2,3-bis-(O-geranylgeranyl)-sn-glycerol synthase
MPLEPGSIIRVLILIGAANGAPVIARKLLGHQFAHPIDAGRIFNDNHPIFGRSKTWRGLITAILCTAMIAPLLDLTFMFGASFGAVSIGADLVASFCKRRLGYAPSSRARFLDTCPEALLPMLVFHLPLKLNHWEILISVLIFFVLEVSISPLLYRLHIRNRPY